MKKLSFDELENTLTRTEMRSILAGSGGDCNPPCHGHICCPCGKCAGSIEGCEVVCKN